MDREALLMILPSYETFLSKSADEKRRVLSTFVGKTWDAIVAEGREPDEWELAHLYAISQAQKAKLKKAYWVASVTLSIDRTPSTFDLPLLNVSNHHAISMILAYSCM